MKKVIKSEKIIKRFFTKAQIRYINSKGWAFILESMVPSGCHYKHIGSNVSELTVTTSEQSVKVEKALLRRANILLAKIPSDIEEYYEKIDRETARELRDLKKIEKMLAANRFIDIYYAIEHLRTGEHVKGYSAEYGRYNAISCREYKDFDGYGRSCSFPLISRRFNLTIRRGWNLFYIGGLLTFVRAKKIDRMGMACEWIEQGKSISDIRTIKGYIVRGEHIVASNLKEAKAISAQHRAITLSRLLASRQNARRRAQQKADGNIRITLRDSIEAGNCRPGTAEFRKKYEAAIGRTAKDISIADLRKYAKVFGVEYYAERVITYVLNH